MLKDENCEFKFKWASWKREEKAILINCKTEEEYTYIDFETRKNYWLIYIYLFIYFNKPLSWLCVELVSTQLRPGCSVLLLKCWLRESQPGPDQLSQLGGDWTGPSLLAASPLSSPHLTCISYLQQPGPRTQLATNQGKGTVSTVHSSLSTLHSSLFPQEMLESLSKLIRFKCTFSVGALW